MSSDFEQLVETLAAEAAHHAAEVDRGNFPAQTIRRLGETGLLGLTSSPEVGGRGEGLSAAAYLVERLARQCGSTGMVVCMHFSATAIVEQHGPREIREAIAAGRHLTTLALSEAGSRSHFWASSGTATPDGADVRLSARKSFITSARHADSYVWSSKPIAASGLSTLWLVPRTAAGLRPGPAFDGLGLRGNDSGPVTGEDVRVPASARLGEDGGGFDLMMGKALQYFCLLSASVSLGLMEAALQATIAHVTRTRFDYAGSSIADLPTVRAYIARARIATDQVRTLVADAIAAIEAGRADAMLRMLESKAAAGEAAAMVTDLAMRVCGGVAFRKEVGIERMFRDARAAQVMGPTTDVLYDLIGKAVCGMPVFEA